MILGRETSIVSPELPKFHSEMVLFECDIILWLFTPATSLWRFDVASTKNACQKPT